ncbi:MAG TPA: hypothetical protein VFH33_09115, partial [Candidatus Krumholzibacteria bacterium]|nr:hypothetical protein [Candidatus Krumholzibacteria bacterium]
ARTISRDPGTGARVIMRNVSACTFSYFTSTNVQLNPPLTAAQRGTIKTIGINVSTDTPRGGTVTTDTRVTIRNE